MIERGEHLTPGVEVHGGVRDPARGEHRFLTNEWREAFAASTNMEHLYE